ncbi:MAG TPA: LysE family translocator [Microvirga sp.]|jgi:threonine/homoserine/homoserine lactone efflux protein
MISAVTLTAFAAVAFGIAITPGPNTAYLVSRSICQGRGAGVLSLAGVMTGHVVYMLLAAFGIMAVLLAIPYAYDALRIAGAAYLAYLAYQAVKPNGASPFEIRTLSPDSSFRLFTMGLLTNLLNPKVAVLYLSLIPQFVDPGKGAVLMQSVGLGFVQIGISLMVGIAIVLTAGSVARFLDRRPSWIRMQRWLLGAVLGGLAVRMLVDVRR